MNHFSIRWVAESEDKPMPHTPHQGLALCCRAFKKWSSVGLYRDFMWVWGGIQTPLTRRKLAGSAVSAAQGGDKQTTAFSKSTQPFSAIKKLGSFLSSPLVHEDHERGPHRRLSFDLCDWSRVPLGAPGPSLLLRVIPRLSKGPQGNGSY